MARAVGQLYQPRSSERSEELTQNPVRGEPEEDEPVSEAAILVLWRQILGHLTMIERRDGTEDGSLECGVDICKTSEVSSGS